MKQPTTIVLAGGGSGGHITPILPLAHELKKINPDVQLVYIGHKGDNFKDLNLSTKDFTATYFINAGKFRRYHGENFLSHLTDIKTLLLNARDFFRLLASTFAAVRILHKVKPQVVFSKGGFVVVPVGIAAHWLGAPIVTHDSDIVPGLANRIVGRWAITHATGMPTKYYSYPKSTMVYTGTPINPAIKRVSASDQAAFKQAAGLPADSKVLLVGGAGNGSELINNLVVSIASELMAATPRLHILHFSGQKHEESMNQKYAAKLSTDQLSRVKVYGFEPDFYKFSGAADVIISRAGATALAEFAAQSKACVIIPSPFLAGGHQLQNAKILEDSKSALVLEENVEPEELLTTLNGLLSNEDKRQQLAANLTQTLGQQGAALKLAQILTEIANRPKAAAGK